LAIFHLAAKVISRTKKQNAVAAAAYRSAIRLTDFATGEVKRYADRKTRVIFSRIYAPPDAPAWARDREQLWNRVEAIETRRNSCLAREYEIALPSELSDVQRIWLMEDFVRENFTRLGLIVDANVHDPDRDADARNYHVHLMVPERQVGAGGFARTKIRSLQQREFLYTLRAQFSHLANRHLQRHGHAARIDHRTLKAQGSQNEADIHLGYIAGQIERRGGLSERGEIRRKIRARNAERRASDLAQAMARSAAAVAEARHRHYEAAADEHMEELDFQATQDIWGKPLGPR